MTSVDQFDKFQAALRRFEAGRLDTTDKDSNWRAMRFHDNEREAAE